MAPSFPIEFTGQRESKKCSQTGLHQMMGKSRKVSKGYSSGFVPDYRHAVETMAESEGFGSSGRVDTEITVSEDSCAPQRKCISLNVDSYDRFGVPIQVLSLSKMTESERKDLEVRLKLELQQIRVLQKKIASLGSNFTVTSPASDFHSCSDGQKRSLPDTLQRLMSVGAPVSQGKKRAPPGRNGARTKRPPGRVDPVNLVKQGIMSQVSTNAMIMKQCETLLNRLMQHQHAWVFNTPVDVVKLNIPDYYTVIEHPMDLGTVKSKLASGEYMNAVSFAADVRLTFKNAMTYNPKGNDVHYMAETLSKYFEVRWKPIERKLPSNVYAPTRLSGYMESETANRMPPAKRTKVTSAKNIARQEQPIIRLMSATEKARLSSELEALLAELPESIIDFLKESTFSDGQEEEIEIDFEALSDDTLLTLRKLLDDFMASKQKNQAKAETCEMEIHNESGFSNSSVQPCKGNENLDEDVDIGGNDLPISSFPPVEIEKDTTAAVRNSSKCTSSSSSSSDSGSSSSDSDSGSSSGSESGGAKASVPINSAKETLYSGGNLEHGKSDRGDANIGTHTLNELNQVELESQSKPTVSVDGGDGHQEGESAPSERQVSPDKLYRAALLRNRFADTILKAQEKTLAKDEKQDPERLRLEKEELERRRKEEKARLQAEAKAAEEARKKAEAEAAAEAKRKRELEREAARIALQKMEKTVDINENSQFMEDLEMLRVAQPDNMQSMMIDETSLDDESPEGGGLMGSFKFQGNSNPLEQLGLFMKADDDEEEGEPQTVPPPTFEPQEDDAEEGEID